MMFSASLAKNKKEMVVNGDFSAGNVSFFTDYRYSPGNMRPATCYTITKNAKQEYFKFDSCKDHTSGDGYYLMVNGSDSANRIVWAQTINNIEKFQTYEFSVWLMSIDTLNPGIIHFYINGVEFKNSPVFLKPDKCQWFEYKHLWYSAGSDTARITLVDSYQRYYGNDFGVDDISFKSECELYTSAGPDTTICMGESVVIGDSVWGNMPPYKFSWWPSKWISSVDVLNPTVTPPRSTSYLLTVTDSMGCMAFDTVTVWVSDPPVSEISSVRNPNICPCDTITLVSKDANKYLWSTGERTKSIVVSTPGIYTITVYNTLGCWSESEFEVTNLPYYFDISLNLDTAGIGEIIELNWAIQTNATNGSCRDYYLDAELVYNSTILTCLNPDIVRDRNVDDEILRLKNIPIDSLKTIKFRTSLGNSSATPINIFKEKMDCPSVNLFMGGGVLLLNDLCEEGGVRYFIDSKGIFGIHSIYPNPASSDFTADINIIEETEFTLSIVNQLGQTIKTIPRKFNKAGNYKEKIDIRDLSAGIYFLKLQSINSVKYQRFSIIH